MLPTFLKLHIQKKQSVKKFTDPEKIQENMIKQLRKQLKCSAAIIIYINISLPTSYTEEKTLELFPYLPAPWKLNKDLQIVVGCLMPLL